MPKASKGRKKTTKIGTVQRASQLAARPAAQVSGAAQTAPATAGRASRRVVPSAVAGPQSLVLPGMVALGCWGMAFTLAYFYSDPNRFIYAGMAALMGLFWTYSLYTRVRKMRKTH